MKKMLILLFALLVTSCASSHVVKQPIALPTAPVDLKYSIINIEDQSKRPVPEQFLVAIKGYLNAELSQKNMIADENSLPNREIKISVIYYRMRSGFNRAMFGVMAGKDGVTSKVTVLDPKTGALLGESEVDTYNVLAVGDEQDVAKMHAEEIVKFLEEKPK
jgi:hypothetical protein